MKSVHRRCKQAIDKGTILPDRISSMGIGVNVGQLLKMLVKLQIPNNAKIKFAIGQPTPGWALLESVSFCRKANEVSLW